MNTTTTALPTVPNLSRVGGHGAATRRLVACGFVAAPVYLVASLVQAFTRDGFDLTRHQWSLLLNGDLGWIQVLNFIGTGVLFVAFAVGLRRVLAPAEGSRWAPRLVAVFGTSMAAAGVFKADPALGFPVGTPNGPPAEVTTAGVIHFAAASVGFLAIALACFVLARRQGRDGARNLARASRITGVSFLAGFLCVASGAGGVVANLLFVASVVLVFAWLTLLAGHCYRAIAPGRTTDARS